MFGFPHFHNSLQNRRSMFSPSTRLELRKIKQVNLTSPTYLYHKSMHTHTPRKQQFKKRRKVLLQANEMRYQRIGLSFPFLPKTRSSQVQVCTQPTPKVLNIHIHISLGPSIPARPILLSIDSPIPPESSLPWRELRRSRQLYEK
jgi:hypothetical protein